MMETKNDVCPYNVVKRGGKYIIISSYDGRKIGTLSK